MLAPSNIRVDAWINPPIYTAKPPIILSAANKEAAALPMSGPLAVPANSTLIVRSSGGTLDVVAGGGVSEVTPSEKAPTGTNEKHFTIAADGTVHVRAPSGQPQWKFTAIPDRPPTIALAKDPERQARGSLQMAYKIEDDYGVTEAQAHFSARTGEGAAATRPLYTPPSFSLVLPNARTRNGVGQTVKDLSEDPYAGADVTLTLTAKDEAGNEGKSEPFNMRLPERLFTKPLARALIEQRRILALDANKNSEVFTALDALLIAPELFMAGEAGHYLGLYNLARQLEASRTDDELREVVASLWALAVTIEDGAISDVDKALRAAQDALKQALERGASDEEIKKLTQDLRQAMDNYMRQLAEQFRNNPQALARPLDPNTKVPAPAGPQQHAGADGAAVAPGRQGRRAAIARAAAADAGESADGAARAGRRQRHGAGAQRARRHDPQAAAVARQDLQAGPGFAARSSARGKQGDQSMGDLQQDQQGLRDRLKKLQDELAKRGLGPGQRGDQGQPGADQGDGEDGLAEADGAMGDAGSRLGEGNADAAVDSQGKALEALRKGAQSLADAMQQGDGDQAGDGPGDRMGRQQSGANGTDPLGRPLRGREWGDELSRMIPGEMDVQRVRRILEELRRRLSDPSRPQIELDYIERLLKDY